MAADARLLELEWLARYEQGRPPTLRPATEDSPEARLGDYLSRRGFISNRHVKDSTLRITHEGAVRRAELAEQLKASRIREPMGLVWDGRHFDRDTRIALLDAAPERPLALTYLDLNDVRAFNANSHAVGDQAIRRYLEVIADVSGARDAYRLSGGADEVVILSPGQSLDRALDFTRQLLLALGLETVGGLTLRAAGGVITTTDPTERVPLLKERADLEQARAKRASRASPKRPSALAWPGSDIEFVPPMAGSQPG
jgi:GGDEF domain-containing protein